MPGRPTLRLVLVAAAALILVAAAPVQAGPRQSGLGRSGRVHYRLHQARSAWHYRLSYGRGVWRHHGLGHGGYGYSSGVRRHHGLGDGFYTAHDPSRYWNAVRPYYVVPYPYAYGYGYDGWITVGAPDYHRTSEPPVFEVVTTQGADTAPAAPKPTRSEIAWSLLARGEAKAALREFAVLALRSTRDAEARAGYGLAAAMLGKHDTAVWAMRRALVTNVEAVHDLALDDELSGRVRRLAGHYAGQARGSGKTDARFMTAALLLLLHDDDAARTAIAAAIDAGDTEPSTQALHDLLAAERNRGGTDPTENIGGLVANN